MSTAFMKTTWLVRGLAVTVAAASCAVAGEQAKDNSKGGKEAKPAVAPQKEKREMVLTPQKERAVLLTGSNIRQDIRRSGMIVDGPNNLQYIDRATIDRSGAANLSQALFLTGAR
jgi:hypothetical protein